MMTWVEAPAKKHRAQKKNHTRTTRAATLSTKIDLFPVVDAHTHARCLPAQPPPVSSPGRRKRRGALCVYVLISRQTPNKLIRLLNRYVFRGDDRPPPPKRRTACGDSGCVTPERLSLCRCSHHDTKTATTPFPPPALFHINCLFIMATSALARALNAPSARVCIIMSLVVHKSDERPSAVVAVAAVAIRVHRRRRPANVCECVACCACTSHTADAVLGVWSGCMRIICPRKIIIMHIV